MPSVLPRRNAAQTSAGAQFTNPTRKSHPIELRFSLKDYTSSVCVEYILHTPAAAEQINTAQANIIAFEFPAVNTSNLLTRRSEMTWKACWEMQ